MSSSSRAGRGPADRGCTGNDETPRATGAFLICGRFWLAVVRGCWCGLGRTAGNKGVADRCRGCSLVSLRCYGTINSPTKGESTCPGRRSAGWLVLGEFAVLWHGKLTNEGRIRLSGHPLLPVVRESPRRSFLHLLRLT